MGVGKIFALFIEYHKRCWCRSSDKRVFRLFRTWMEALKSRWKFLKNFLFCYTFVSFLPIHQTVSPVSIFLCPSYWVQSRHWLCLCTFKMMDGIENWKAPLYTRPKMRIKPFLFKHKTRGKRQPTLLPLDNDVIPLISRSPRRFSAKVLKQRECYSEWQFMLEIAFAIFPNRTRKFYQEISFSAFNNFHIIQFYFQFPIARKKLWMNSAECCCVCRAEKQRISSEGLLKCHRILWDIYSARPDTTRPDSKNLPSTAII